MWIVDLVRWLTRCPDDYPGKPVVFLVLVCVFRALVVLAVLYAIYQIPGLVNALYNPGP